MSNQITSERLQATMREELARAMGWTSQECLLHSMSKTCWASPDGNKKHQVWPPDPFTSADDSLALVEWIVTQPVETRRRFDTAFCDLMRQRPGWQMPGKSILELLAADKAIIAEAA